jgi:hypothetical protein
MDIEAKDTMTVFMSNWHRDLNDVPYHDERAHSLREELFDPKNPVLAKVFRLSALKTVVKSSQSLVDDTTGRIYKIVDISGTHEQGVFIKSSSPSPIKCVTEKNGKKQKHLKKVRHMRKQKSPVRLEIKRGGIVGGI